MSSEAGRPQEAKQKHPGGRETPGGRRSCRTDAGQAVQALRRLAGGGRVGCERRREAVERRPARSPQRCPRPCSAEDSVVQLSLPWPPRRSSLFSDVRYESWFLPLATKMDLSTKVISISQVRNLGHKDGGTTVTGQLRSDVNTAQHTTLPPPAQN